MKYFIKGIYHNLSRKYYSITNKLILKCRHVDYGNKLETVGRLYCVSDMPHSIQIGNNVSINSSFKSNPIGGDCRTTFFTREDGRIIIGNGCKLSNVTLFSTELIQLGKNVMVGGGVKIYDTDFHSLDFEKRMNGNVGVSKAVLIEDGAFIGAHSIILKGTKIGEQSIIGAGSVVTKDIPAGEIWAGNPAKFIRKIV